MNPSFASRLLPLLLVAPAASAALVPIANPGFELDAVTPGAFVVGVPTGWSVYDPGTRLNQAQDAVGRIRPLPGTEYYPGGTPEGDQAALVFLSSSATTPAGLQQTLGATLSAHTVYTLSVDIGNIASGTSLPGSTGGAGVFFDLRGFPGYRLELLAGDTVLAADDDSLGASIADGTFRTATLQHDAGAAPALLGQPLTLRLINLSRRDASGPAIEVNFDDVRLDASPAALALALPASGWLVLAALLAAAALRRSGHAIGLDSSAAFDGQEEAKCPNPSSPRSTATSAASCCRRWPTATA